MNSYNKERMIADKSGNMRVKAGNFREGRKNNLEMITRNKEVCLTTRA